jgi:hypothetical protein
MAVEERLKEYWQNAFLWHRTGEPVWLTLLDLMTHTGKGPGAQAAARLIASQNKKITDDTS